MKSRLIALIVTGCCISLIEVNGAPLKQREGEIYDEAARTHRAMMKRELPSKARRLVRHPERIRQERSVRTSRTATVYKETVTTESEYVDVYEPIGYPYDLPPDQRVFRPLFGY